MRYERINLRQLLKDTLRAWKAAGVPARRGARFADLGQSRRTLELMFDLHRAVNEKRIDIDALVRGEFDDAARAIMQRHGIETA